MYDLIERNERRARTHAMVFAVALHIGLGVLLYVQMDSATPSKTNVPAKVNYDRQAPAPVAKTVSHP